MTTLVAARLPALHLQTLGVLMIFAAVVLAGLSISGEGTAPRALGAEARLSRALEGFDLVSTTFPTSVSSATHHRRYVLQGAGAGNHIEILRFAKTAEARSYLVHQGVRTGCYEEVGSTTCRIRNGNSVLIARSGVSCPSKRTRESASRRAKHLLEIGEDILLKPT